MSDETKYIILHESTKASIIKDFASVGWLGFAVAANHLLGASSEWIDFYAVVLSALYVFAKIGTEKVARMTFDELAESVDKARNMADATLGQTTVNGVEIIGFHTKSGDPGVGIRMRYNGHLLMAPYSIEEARDVADGINEAARVVEKKTMAGEKPGDGNGRWSVYTRPK